MQTKSRGLVVALASLALAVTMGPADAKPPAKPGTPSNLQVSATKSGPTFAVTSTWTAAPNATRYVARLNANGVTVDQASVTTTTWTGHTTAADGTTVTVSVTAYNGTRKGGVATKNFVLPDLTPPAASYSVAHDPAPRGPNVTVTAQTLSDNATPTASLSQTIDWGDGTTPVPWDPTNPTISHSYPDVEARYVGSVTVADASGNQLVVPLVILVNDETAPTGSFALTNATAWASWTKVGVSQAALSDNQSPADKISRVINWGDGAETVWTAGTNPTHTYATAGQYSPTVELMDEAGNAAIVETSTVVVSVDGTAPTLRLLTPKTRKASVRSWRTLKGTATDAGVGVRNVVLKAVEKRGTAWYAYKAARGTWVKAGSKAKALSQATYASVRPSATGVWAVKLQRLTRGTLLYKVRAFDNRSNASALVTKRAVLTRR